MISINGKEYRNLEEQVLENQRKIAEHYAIDRVLADFGIFVVGNLPSAQDLVGKVGEAYGEAYGIGTAPPYTFYVWTRANPDIGEDEPYWFNIGQLAIEGPEGPVGPEGPAGATGQRGATIWTFSAAAGKAPNASAFPGLLVLDYALNLQNGEYWKYLGSSRWELLGLLRGTQGIQGPEGPRGPEGPAGPAGPQGPQGDPGKFIHIAGVIPSAAQLIDPATLRDLSKAYLVGSVAPYDLYIQVGNTPDTASWVNTGHINNGTVVSVNGVAQETWNADGKLDKQTTTAGKQYLYGFNGPAQTIFPLDVSWGANYIPVRDPVGNVYAPPLSQQEQSAGRGYISGQYAEKLIDDKLANFELPTLQSPVYEHNIFVAGVYGTYPYGYFRTSILTNSADPLTAAQIFDYLLNKSSSEGVVVRSFEAFVDYQTSETTFVTVPAWNLTVSASNATLQFFDSSGWEQTYVISAATADVTDVVNLIAQVDGSGGGSGGGKLYRHDITLFANVETASGTQELNGTVTIYNHKNTTATIDDIAPLTESGGYPVALIPITSASLGESILIVNIARFINGDDDAIIMSTYDGTTIGNVAAATSVLTVLTDYITEV